MEYTAPFSVTSEIGRLREVIVHRPGREIEMVSPRNFGRMLFDDILYLQGALEDHNRLVRILQKAGVVVHFFQDLLAETLHLIGQEERENFVRRVTQFEGCPPAYCEKLSGYSPDGLADVLIGGEPREESLTRFLRQDIYAFPPIPNMMFVRDSATVVGNSILLSSMAHAVRSREVLLLDLVFGHHPRFCHNRTPPWHWLGNLRSRFEREEMIRGQIGYEHVSLEGTNLRLSGLKPELSGGTEQLASDRKSVTLEADYVRFTGGPDYALEGGNVFILSPDTLLVGCGRRTSAAGIDALARDLLGRRSTFRNILVAIMADDKDRHLDTFFSVLDKDQYMIYGPVMEEYGASVTWLRMWLDKRQIRVQAYDTMEQALESVGLTYARENVGYCAGIEPPSRKQTGGESVRTRVKNRILQEREWHNQALNLLCLAPGKLIASERNRETLDHLLDKRLGYREIAAEVFLDLDDALAKEYLDSEERYVVTLDDSELSRAHGGPRSLVLPLRRDDVQGSQRRQKRTYRAVPLTGAPQETDAQQRDSQETEPKDLKLIDLCICSETGLLRKVVLHTPGVEIQRLTPSNHDALLCDDVLVQPYAAREHREFRGLLTALKIEVLEIEDLVTAALDADIKSLEPPEVAGSRLNSLLAELTELQKESVEERGDKWLPSYSLTLRNKLRKKWNKGSRQFARALIGGILADDAHPALFLHDTDPFLLTPLPNMMFMRDVAAVVGKGAIVCYMRRPARRREALLLHYILQAMMSQYRQDADRDVEVRKCNLLYDCFLEKREAEDNKRRIEEKLRLTEFAKLDAQIKHARLAGTGQLESNDNLEVAERRLEEATEQYEEAKVDLEKAQEQLDAISERAKLQRVEGGDILVIHDRILAIGCSERTTREMLEELAKQIFSKQKQEGVQPSIEVIFAVLMPAQRSSMHLDTIFTMLSENECLVYQPMIMPDGVEQVRVIKITAPTPEKKPVPDQTGFDSCDEDDSSARVDEKQDRRRCVPFVTYQNHRDDEVLRVSEVNSLVRELELAISEYTHDPNYRLTPILAGGENPLYQDREQWCDAANVLAIAPGVVIGYERNYRTFRELDKAGYHICHARDIYDYGEDGKPKLTPLGTEVLEAMEDSIREHPNSRRARRKYAIQIAGRELSRARGGPRCMSMPLFREAVRWESSSR